MDTLIDVLGRKRLFDFARHVDARQRSPVVPLRIERLRVDLAERQVIRKPQQRFGQQHVVLRAHRIGRRRSRDLPGQIIEQRQKIVLGIEPFFVTIRECAPQLLCVARAAPSRAESAMGIELLEPLQKCDALAVNCGLRRSRPSIELSRNGLLQRIAIRCCRLREGARHCESGCRAGEPESRDHARRYHAAFAGQHRQCSHAGLPDVRTKISVGG